MEKNKKYINYIESLNQKYNAVCFDIDGTLTKENSNEIDEIAIKLIAMLLKKKIPIVFITGRGEIGVNSLEQNIYKKLIEIYKISNKELKRMYILTNDGARLFFTSNDYNEGLFNEKKYISSNVSLEQLSKFNDNVIKSINQSLLTNFCNITYSKDSNTGKILNIRLVFTTNDENKVKSIIDLINISLKESNYNQLVVTRGVYKGNSVIQIGVAKKEIAIEQAEKIIGVPRNSMIRIGDCGDEYGNDYSMLDCEQGYSVNKYSSNPNGCFPIYNDQGNILTGIEATLFLINKAKIIPTVCLESANKIDYSNNYAKIEYAITRGRNNHLVYYNNIINKTLDLVYGINDLFDMSSGSIKIPMYEWQMISDDNPLKKLFNSGNKDTLFYSIRDNNNYLLRGSKTYYYFLANRFASETEDYTSFSNVYEWYKNNINFINNSILAISLDYNYNDIVSRKLMLGLLDNVRNIILILINHNLISKYEEKNLLININSKSDKQINYLYNLLYSNDLLMSKICFTPGFLLNICDLKKILIEIENILVNEQHNFIKNNQDKDYSKEYRAYREIDNFAENYITINLDYDKKINREGYGVCGTCYGGLELPVIYKIINPKINDILLLKFSSDVSGYKNKQLVDLRRFNIKEYGGIFEIGIINNSNIILLDDNILTGKTMQLAINSLYDVGINTQNINVVRYPSLNRVDQMFMKNHGAVDYHLFFDYITGLCFPSPYSWRDNNNLDPYLDSLGVFDLNRKKIIECLVKNHDYKENTEVAEYIRNLKL